MNAGAKSITFARIFAGVP